MVGVAIFCYDLEITKYNYTIDKMSLSSIFIIQYFINLLPSGNKVIQKHFFINYRIRILNYGTVSTR